MSARKKIRATKSKPKILSLDSPREIGHQARMFLEKLEQLATAGNADAKDELGWLLSNALDEIKKQIEKNSKAGQLSDRLPPIKTILDFCDFSIPLLLWLSEHKPENIRKYARDKWQWPSLIHLCKREQSRYETAMPIKELGANLPLNINKSRTNGDYIFTVSAHAVFSVTNFEPHLHKFSSGHEEIVHWNLRWLRGHDARFRKMDSEKFQTAAEAFLRSLGKFSRKNFAQWKPAFETFLTMSHGPFKERLLRLNVKADDELINAMKDGTLPLGNKLLEHLKQLQKAQGISDKKLQDAWRFFHDLSWFYFRTPQLLESDQQAIIDIANRCKTEDGKWTELKDVILKRIEKLATVS